MFAIFSKACSRKGQVGYGAEKPVLAKACARRLRTTASAMVPILMESSCCGNSKRSTAGWSARSLEGFPGCFETTDDTQGLSRLVPQGHQAAGDQCDNCLGSCVSSGDSSADFWKSSCVTIGSSWSNAKMVGPLRLISQDRPSTILRGCSRAMVNPNADLSSASISWPWSQVIPKLEMEKSTPFKQTNARTTF